MSEEPLQVTIKILDKEYRVGCESREQEDLRASARLLDSRMREIRQTGRIIGTDRIAVMAALNIAHDLVQLQRSKTGGTSDARSVKRLQQLQERVSQALAGEPTEHREPVVAPKDAPKEQSERAAPLDAPDEKV